MKLLRNFVIIVLGVLVLIVIIKLSIVEVWISEDYISTYSIHGVDGRNMILSMLSNNHAVFYYSDNNGLEDLVFVKMRGEYGRRFVGNLWRIGGPETMLRFGFFDKETRPVNMSIKILEKYTTPEKESSFYDIGETFHSIMQFKDNAIYFSGMWLERNTDDEIFVKEMMYNYKIGNLVN